jgi:hypothetical protein
MAAKRNDLLPRRCGILANLGSKLDHRLMHLRLDPLFQRHPSAFQDLLNVRPKFARLRIDNLEFLLNAEGEDGDNRSGLR